MENTKKEIQDLKQRETAEMKREIQLIQKLLLKLEEWPARPGDTFLFTGAETELAIDGYSSDQIEYHLTLLKSEGYIESPGSQPMLGVTFRGLTSRGHDFLDQYRETVREMEIEQAKEESQKWISAADAANLLKPVFNSAYVAKMTICKRAHNGFVRARAQRYMADQKARSDYDIPKEFWWAEGHEALEQNWQTGDFETWIDQKLHLRAFGVSFFRADIMKMVPAAPADEIGVASSGPDTPAGGRPKKDWWDDLWVEICRQLYEGDLQPKTQAEIERAMLQWLSDRGEAGNESTVRPRARKLWTAIGKGKN